MHRPVLQAYYLATPAFALLDVGLGLPARAAGLERPSHRLAYYGVAFGLGLLMRAHPRWAPELGMAESALNLALLMAAVLVPIWSLPETLDTGVATELPSRVLNLALSGSVLVWSIHRTQARIVASTRRSSVADPGG